MTMPRKVEEEYAENSKLNKDDINAIIQWSEKQHHLPKLTEYMVIQFYDSADHSIQRAKELIELHYEFRNDSPELFSGMDFGPPRFNHSFWDMAYCVELPNPTPEGYRLIYTGLRDCDPSKFDFEKGLCMFTKAMIAVILSSGSCPGYGFIFDIKGITLSHFATVTISLVRRYLYFVQEAIPLKVRAVHIINVHSLIDKIMLLAKPFLKKELYDMIRIQSDMNQFYDTVTRETLPIDLGGTLPFTRQELSDMLRNKVADMEKQIMWEMNKRLDESKRMGEKRSNGLSMNGSFKKLDID